MKNVVVFKVGDIIGCLARAEGVYTDLKDPVMGVVLDLYGKKEDFCRYYKAVLDVYPSLFEIKDSYQERYKIHSGHYRENIGRDSTYCLLLIGDQKYLTTTNCLFKLEVG